MTTKIEAGTKAPDFTLPDSNDSQVSLSKYRGKWVVLYFYPKDNTKGCTLEAKDFTCMKDDFAKIGAEIIGISPDSPKSHLRFIDKQELNLTLLSDPEHIALEAYGAWQLKKMYGREYYGVVRSTFLIDPAGDIAYAWQNVKTKGHAEAVLKKLKELQEG